MSKLSEDSAVTVFSEAVSPLLKSRKHTARQIITECLAFYRDVRIVGTDDSMMLEWEMSRPYLPPNPSDAFLDLRSPYVGWEEWRIVDERELPFVQVSRQLFADRGDDDTKLAVNMWFRPLPATRELTIGERTFGSWSIEQTEKHVQEFVSHPFVIHVLDEIPQIRVAYVCELG